MSVIVVDTLYCLTVYRQAALRGLKDILEQTALVLIKASAAGLLFLFRIAPVHHDGLLAAAVIRIVKTIGHIAL